MPPSTTPVLFVVRCSKRAQGGEGWYRLHHRRRHLPRLYARRALCVVAEDPADQLLPVRLRLLHQSPLAPTWRGRVLSVEEVVTLTLEFYKRNYIEGLFLSSGIIKSPDYTMEQLMRVAKNLRAQGFAGLHPSQIHSRSQSLADRAGGALRRSHVHQPGTAQGRKPDDGWRRKKTAVTIASAMGQMQASASSRPRRNGAAFRPPASPRRLLWAPTTASDETVLTSSAVMYGTYRAEAGVLLCLQSRFPTPASLLMPPSRRRCSARTGCIRPTGCCGIYGFTVPMRSRRAARDGMLDLEIDPKLAWALKNRDRISCGCADSGPREMLLRVPGLGARAVDKHHRHPPPHASCGWRI